MQGKLLTAGALVGGGLLAPLTHSATEMVAVAYLDADVDMLGGRHFLSQSVYSIEVSIRAIVIDALALNARYVVLAHNHPSGDVEPSRADITFTRRLFAALEAVGVRLHDHLIVAPGRALSFRSERLL